MAAQWREYIDKAERMFRTSIVDDDYPEMAHYFDSAANHFRRRPRMPKIICLCGSTKFKDAFMDANRRLTNLGNIVLSVGWFGHSEDGEPTDEQKSKLDELHKRKIDLADEILVINVGGYVGVSTRSEIEYAQQTGKIVHFLEKVPCTNM